MASNSNDGVDFDLDALEREDAPKPFVIRRDGKRFLLRDVQEIDWQALLIAETDPREFFRQIVAADDQKEFFAPGMPSWKLTELLTAYRKHYGLPSLPERGASSTS